MADPKRRDAFPRAWIYPGQPESEQADTPSPYAKPGSHLTALAPAEELSFQNWKKAKNIPFDPGPNSNYDMRGYYHSTRGGSGQSINQGDNQLHFTDQFKTPYHTKFSVDSQYATPDAPHWEDDTRLVDKSGRVLADETPLPGPAYHLPPGLDKEDKSVRMPKLPIGFTAIK